MAYSNKAIEKMERSIPEKAAKAVKVAYKQAINSGQPVLVSSHGALFEIVLGEYRKEVKRLPARIQIQKGTRFKIK